MYALILADPMLFLSTLSLRRATNTADQEARKRLISIHALLAESDDARRFQSFCQSGFLSTLSLRRATVYWLSLIFFRWNFYPRSPCGERRWLRCWQLAARDISIHALLAESDVSAELRVFQVDKISIHALLAESDGVHFDNFNLHCVISIHALLAESDFGRAFWPGLSF